MLFNKKSLITLTLTLLLSVTNIQASTVYDFRDNNSGNPRTGYTEIDGSGYGNGLHFGDMIASAWAATGVPNSSNNNKINSAQIHQWSTGLGSCNRDEGKVGNGCDTNTEHQVDNIGADDFILFLFDGLVEFENIKIDPFGDTANDRDVSFWVGTILDETVLSGLKPGQLNNNTNTVGFGNYNQQKFTDGTGVKTVDLTGANGGNIGNALLFSARTKGNDDDDKFKIRSLKVSEVTVVPVPAAVWLFGTGLIGLVGIARRKSTL